jgi:hypothetical protein
MMRENGFQKLFSFCPFPSFGSISLDFCADARLYLSKVLLLRHSPYFSLFFLSSCIDLLLSFYDFSLFLPVMYVHLFFGCIRRTFTLLSVRVQNSDFEDTAVHDSVTLLMMVIFYNMGNTIYLIDSLFTSWFQCK